jgi:N-acetylmuramoyl-L-alanine amidase
MFKINTKNILLFLTIISFAITVSVVVSQNLYIFKKYQSNKKIKLLLVAGHEPNDGGAEYNGLKERDLNLQIASKIKDILSSSTDIEIILARDNDGWNDELESYVKTNETKIMDWVAESKAKMFSQTKTGEIKIVESGMKHNMAASNAVLFLYGTNKWIDEKDIDVVLHVHMNNNPKYKGKPNYSGYCMYVPEKQFSNSSSSKIFAKFLDEEISKIHTKSTMPQEKDIIIESQELIAVGSYGTLKIPSVVVEYAYIYEPIITNKNSRKVFIENFSSSTAVAIEKYIQKVWKK